MPAYQSWGRYPRASHDLVVPIRWRHELPDLAALPAPMLAYGLGRSYGDSCLNRNGTLLPTEALNRVISFDEKTGVLRCEAGASLADVQARLIPRGYFLPVIPGTKFVTVGGAVANDIHGKNHHLRGTFGCHVLRFELVRSDGAVLECSPDDNADLYRATIGGLGLTGLMTWVELRAIRVASPFIDHETIRYHTLDEFFALSADSDEGYEYTVAWVDTTATGHDLGRGLFIRGNHADPAHHKLPPIPKAKERSFPVEAPSWFLNRFAVKAFNALYYRKRFPRHIHEIVYQDPFFHPLDSVLHWNRMYGKRGFLQYQCVVPADDGGAAIREILERIAASGLSSFLAVLKMFGDVESPGMLSFPQPGVTLALDFRFDAQRTLRLLDSLDDVTRAAGGRIYPAKDARMSPASFDRYYPQWRAFAEFIDPKFSSSFWRRVTDGLQP